MAKWGEGDPRWIVEDRPDATNVNNWHWTEKNASQWSKDRLRELLIGLEVDDGKGAKCRVTDVTEVEGEASANNRKAKLIFFYEWVIKLEFKGRVDGDDEIEGGVEIPNLSEENEPDELDVNVTVKGTSKHAEQLKQLMRDDGARAIRQRLSQYGKDLKHEFAIGMILPKKGTVETATNGMSGDVTRLQTARPSGSSSSSSTESATSRLDKLVIGRGQPPETTDIVQTETFKCTAEELYNALTVKEMVQAFTRGPCDLHLKVGGQFHLFDNNISGKFLKLVPHKCIQMTWRFSGWPSDHYSTVNLEFEQKDDCTGLTLTQTGVPTTDVERTRSGWIHYYWDSLKRTFGFGATLF